VRTVAVLLAITGLATATAASAQAFRCTDAQGRVTYQQAPCPGSADEKKIDTTPANTDYDPSQRERVLKQGEEAQRRLEERVAQEEADRKRQREQRERDEQREREQREREEAREAPVLYYGPGIYRPIAPARPKPKPLPAPKTAAPAPR
jgi:hypothetical protein